MKKIFSIAAMAALAMVSVNVLAADTDESTEKRGGHGPGGHHMMTPEKRVEMIDKDVTLTDEQKTALTTYYTELDAQRKANRPEEGTRPDEETMKAQMKADREAEQAKLKEVLTDEQYAAYEKALANRPAPKEGRGGRGPRPESESTTEE